MSIVIDERTGQIVDTDERRARRQRTKRERQQARREARRLKQAARNIVVDELPVDVYELHGGLID